MNLTAPLAAPFYLSGNDFYFKSWLYIGGQHAAWDVAPAGRVARGEPILAMEAGTLRQGIGQPHYYSGYYCQVHHAQGWVTGYRHFREMSPLADGTPVARGQVIGYMDNTGVSMGDHLHFDIWNVQPLSPEAFLKGIYWAHDPGIWIGKELGGATPEEDWFDMATIEELRTVVRQEIAANGMLQHIYHVLQDEQEGRPRWVDWTIDLNDIKEAANQSRAILFDDMSNDSPNDKRRLIGIGQQVKASAGTRPKYNLTAAEKATMTKWMARAGNPQAPALTLAEIQSLMSISQKLFGG